MGEPSTQQSASGPGPGGPAPRHPGPRDPGPGSGRPAADAGLDGVGGPEAARGPESAGGPEAVGGLDGVGAPEAARGPESAGGSQSAGGPESAGGPGAGSNPGAQGGAGSGPDPDGVIDLLGVLAYASLVAFFRLSDDAAIATSLADREAMAGMAVAQFGHFQLLRRRLEKMQVDPEQAMSPFIAAIDAFHARTAPADWLEGLVKAYVGDGIAADFYRALASLLDPENRELVLEVLGDDGHAEFAVARVRAAIEADPKVAGRLALWARRLVGEALGQAQRVAAEREALARLLAGGTVSQLGEIGRMFARLTDAHAERMAALGLPS